MAEQLTSKRQREETQTSNQETKRHKAYNHRLSLIEAEEDEPTQDGSSIINTLQKHISSDSVVDVPFQTSQPTTPPLKADEQENPTVMVSIEDYTTATSSLKGDEDYRDEEKEQVIRHLLEASDDELGIPSREDVVGVELDEGVDTGGNGLALCDGLWELEDEAANYYTLLQSELFM